MKILLDLDGVMISHRGLKFKDDNFPEFFPDSILALNSLRNVDIILTSSLRFTKTLNEWVEIFNNRNVLFNNFSILPKGDKFEQILTISQNLADYIIIDDDMMFFDLPLEIKKYLIRVSPFIGLRKIDINHLI